MKSLFRYSLFLVIGYLFALAGLWHKSQNELAKQKASKEQIGVIQSKETQAILSRQKKQQSFVQAGYVKSTRDDEKFHSHDLVVAISFIRDNVKAGNYVWNDKGGNPFAYAAMGIDRNYYFASSYLVGYQPYKTNKIWQPLVTLALRKTYQFDHHQHGPSWGDIWQNSKQAYFYSHGDCEDHAILLADWLISMGYDARVAIGRVPSGGHAWVILYYEDKEYLLEATSKRRPRSIRDFKLAKYAPEYRPQYLFNRTTFWTNTGSQMTTKYSGEKWLKTSNFKRALYKAD